MNDLTLNTRRTKAWAVAALAGGLAFSWAAGSPPRAAGEAAKAEGLKLEASLTNKDLTGYGINPLFIVAVRLADGAERVVIAEHRPGHDSALHVLKTNGTYGFQFDVASPQLVDFTVDAAGSSAFLVGSLGTRFYSADLGARTAKLVLSSLPDKPGFRALPPVSIVRSSQGPLVYGLFYDSKDVSRETGFGRVWDNGTATNLMPTAAWDKTFGQVLSYAPQSLLRSALLVTQDAGKWTNPSKPKPKHLRVAQLSGEAQEIDVADDIFGAAWSPDDESFVYVRRTGSKQELVMHSRSGNKVLASGRYFAPAFLNGGKTLIVSTKESKGNKVWTLSLPDGAPKSVDLPAGPCVYVTDPGGHAVAAWGPWGLRVFTVSAG
ncbi:MAG: hypothetical protein NTX64_18915 [Elusimicrobia bacterium]|nr:hypothetical protein [Elusimicrobiota bacterium]